MSKTGSITSIELNDKIEAGENVQIIDVRPEQDYLLGHIPGSINLPLSHFVRDISTITFEPSIVVVCAIGESSLQAIRLLNSYSAVPQETEILNLIGGYHHWIFSISPT
tara:strand:+ start:90 stop:416 length:327 start_codon:yes stop_codon:yes gene_type:complete